MFAARLNPFNHIVRGIGSHNFGTAPLSVFGFCRRINLGYEAHIISLGGVPAALVCSITLQVKEDSFEIPVFSGQDASEIDVPCICDGVSAKTRNPVVVIAADIGSRETMALVHVNLVHRTC